MIIYIHSFINGGMISNIDLHNNNKNNKQMMVDLLYRRRRKFHIIIIIIIIIIILIPINLAHASVASYCIKKFIPPY